MGKIPNFDCLGLYSCPDKREIWHVEHSPMPNFMFHVYWGNVSPLGHLRSEKPISGPLSKSNTSMLHCVQAGLPVIINDIVQMTSHRIPL